jgi:hypothetical protein
MLQEVQKELIANARDYVFLEGPAQYELAIKKVATGTSTMGAEYFSIDGEVTFADGPTATSPGTAIRIGFKERTSKFGKKSAIKQFLEQVNDFLSATLNVPPSKIPEDIASLGTDKQPLAGLKVRVTVTSQTNPKTGKMFSEYKFFPSK